MTNEVYCFKLLSGDELVATLINTLGDNYEITNPLLLRVRMVEGAIDMGFMPWVFGCGDHRSFPLRVDHVSTMVPAADDVAKAYLSRVSGIDLISTAPSKLLQG